jgi:HSP20 family protein
MVPIKKIPTENLEQIEWPAEEEGEIAIDLYETENELVLKSAIGGVKAENLDISITNDMITITGERQLEEKEEIKKIYYQECFWGRFSRAVILPKEVKSDLATAVIKNGILTIRLPKAGDNKKQGIKIIEEE